MRRFSKNQTHTASAGGHFDLLARSALDFLDQAVRQLESAPKYAVINLATSIELFLKARLVKEHWALVVARPENASITSFNDGSFLSATADATVTRLRDIVAMGLTKDEESCFAALRQHRNRLVHFYDPKYVGEPEDNVRAQIAAEQCRAWYYLQRLLRERWQPHFDQYVRQLDVVKRRVTSNQHFLKGKYLALLPELDAAMERGEKFEKCDVCGNRSAHLDYGGKPVVQVTCGVCDRVALFLEVVCPDCRRPIRVEGMGVGTCTKCGYQVSLEWLLQTLGPDEDPGEGKDEAYCGVCEYPGARTVIAIGEKGDDWLCVACLSTHSRIDSCEWCSERIAGADLEDSFVFGCMLCEGRMAHGD